MLWQRAAKDYTYTGLSMTVAHNPGTDTTIANPRISHKVDAADFNEFITDLGKGATKVGLPTYLINRVAAVACNSAGTSGAEIEFGEEYFLKASDMSGAFLFTQIKNAMQECLHNPIANV